MEMAIVLDSVTKEYPGRTAVKDVSFQVKKGSIHGFLGPNGAGKSTTLKMIAGLMPVSSGNIFLDGSPLKVNDFQLKNKIGLLAENPPLYFDMSVEAYLKYVAKLHGFKNLRDQVEKVMTELKLLEVRKRLIGNLSRGFKQRVGLAQALVFDAPILMLDEPTNGLDPQTVVELREFIKSLAKNKTILFSSHVLSEVEQLCQDITIIHQGVIRASGNLHDIHRKFNQGLVLHLGFRKGQKLPDLSQFGRYHSSNLSSYDNEELIQIVFDEDKDIRSELSRYLVLNGIDLLTLKVESPELEDIFLHMTESAP